MGVQKPESMDIALIELAGYLAGGNIVIPPTSDKDYLFGSIYLPSASPFVMKAYHPDLRTKHVVQNYNNAYPGLEWEQPFWVMGGNNPIIYELVQGPPGMTMAGKLARNSMTGYFEPNEWYGVLKWENPVTGRYRIGIRATDQIGQMVYWIFDLFVGIANHFFMALVATGNGLGTSPSNYASYANTIKGATTESPSKNKVLHIKGDDFPSTAGISANTTYLAASFVAMPSEKPIFHQKFNVITDNIHLHGLTFQGINTDEFGIVGSQNFMNAFAMYKSTFDSCTFSGITNNQSCIAFSRSGPITGRESIFVSQCEFKNCTDLHAFDYYNVKDNVFSMNKLTVTNGSSTLTRSWIFPKQDVQSSDICYNKANIPTVSGGSVSVAQLYHGNFAITSPMINKFEFNYINVGGGQAMQLNFDEGVTPSAVNFDNYVKRNTIVGGSVPYEHWVTNGYPNRRIFLESNVVVNSTGGVVTPANSSTWFSKVGNVEGTNGIVDNNGHFINPADPNRGKAGHGIWKP